MAWWEREYWRDDEDAFRRGGRPIGTIFLGAAHVTAFLALLIAPKSGDVLRALNAEAHPLGLLTHPFAFHGLWGLVMLGFALWLVARRLEEALGARAMLSLYAAGNIAAGVVFFAVARLHPGLARLELAYPIGGLVAWAVAAWRHLTLDSIQILRWSPPLRYLYVGVLAILSASHLSGAGMGGIAWMIAAAAGVASPFAAERGVAFLSTMHRRKPRLCIRRAERPPRERESLESVARSIASSNDREIDAILQKISREGIESLTAAEREKLEQARRALLRKR